ncbi:MAG TPA: Crp/Fnr family transcriptional regulator [Candidatus Saccharimonadales bacterium]|nr:Crp/Fnr family transcriptional regulator [Candidatus Saccharimonadales bacterium]
MDTFKQFISHYPQQSFKKGETILLKGERPKCVYVIESGLVKTYSITKTGDERLVSIGRKDEDFPVGFAFGLIEESQYFYEAFTKCTVRLVPHQKFTKHLHANPESMYNRQVKMTIILLSSISRIHALEQSRASDKVAFTLLYMADQLGGILKSYKFTNHLKISVTQQEIADSLGLTRETTNIELKKLEMLKLIAHSRRSYILHMERLRDYLDQG